jgi:AraC-like DNA-binding protein
MRAAEFVKSYFEAWNNYDPQAIAEHLSAEGVYRNVPENRTFTPAELIVRLKDSFEDFSHHYEMTGEIQTSNDSLAFQYRIYPFKKSHNDEMPVFYHGAEFMTLRGDHALSITDYYDVPSKALAHKYAKSGLTEEQFFKYKRRVDKIMRTRKEYLRPELTLPRLAEVVGCSVNHLSQVINSGFGTSFFDYLNHYRIDHAKELLTNHDDKSNAILHIAFKVGFNSNSAFYTAFKKYVGVTPAQYRQKQFETDEHSS